MNKKREKYLKYLQSNDWKTKRQHIAEIRKFTCEKCKKIIKVGFHIHHKTYKHLGRELDCELMFLCEDCHNKLHYKKNIQRKTKKSSKRRYITCKHCLNKISYARYIKDILIHCPYCNSYIGRPNKLGKIVQKSND